MNTLEHQKHPDGTSVRFTDEAKIMMQPASETTHSCPTPLPTPKGRADSVFTMDNTPDDLHDVILRENGERWGLYWLEAADPQPSADVPVTGEGAQP